MYMALALGLTRHPIERLRKIPLLSLKPSDALWLSVVQPTGSVGQAQPGHGCVFPALMVAAAMTRTVAIKIHRSRAVSADGAHCIRHFTGTASTLLACLTRVSDLQRVTSQECWLQGHSFVPPNSVQISFGTRCGEGP